MKTNQTIRVLHDAKSIPKKLVSNITREMRRRLYNAKYCVYKKLGLSTTRKCIRCSELTDNMRLCTKCFWNEETNDPHGDRERMGKSKPHSIKNTA